MKTLLRRIFPREFFEKPAYFRGIALAGVYIVFLLLQLFTFETLPEVVGNFPLKVGAIGGILFGVGVTLLEILALPALISMRSSKALWMMSRAAVVLVPLVWLLHGVLLYMLSYNGSTGLFGATLDVASGLSFIVFMALTTLTALVIAWELPFRRSTSPTFYRIKKQ